MTATQLLLLTIAVVTLLANNFPGFKKSLLFKPATIKSKREWYRFFSSGFIHADWEHLLFNLLSLYLFGTIVENSFQSNQLFGKDGAVIFVLLFISAIPSSLVYSYIKNYNNKNYASLGASGGVSAIIFSAILIDPTIKIGLFILPPIIPGYIFGPLFILLSAWMSKKGRDNINHAAHIFGAIYGWIFTGLLAYLGNTNLQPMSIFLAVVRKKLGLE